ncbi:MAG: peptide deformylase [Oligoflexia bacterium]|nr:peptide deformylase [Oligoflexia bacterium]
MPIREIIRMGHPTLREKAALVDPKTIKTKDFQSLIDDMVETMHDAEGIGLAAPQIDESIQLAIIEFDQENDRYKIENGQSLVVFINPEIHILGEDSASYWEGCLSVPGLRGKVSRPQHIRVDYLDRDGNAQSIEAKGFLATVIQHELDHLNGTLYIDKLTSPQDLAYVEEFSQFIAKVDDDQSIDD